MMSKLNRRKSATLLLASLCYLNPITAQSGLEEEQVALYHIRPQHITLTEAHNLLNQLYGRQLIFADGRRTQNIILSTDSIIVYEEKDRFEKITETVATLDVKVESVAGDSIVSVYEPKHVDSHTLSQLANQIMGRQIQRGNGNWKSNISLAGTSIVVDDLPEAAGIILTKLEALDDAFAKSSASSPVIDYQTLEYRPRALSLNSINSALQPFYRTINPATGPFGGHMGQVQNIALIQEQGQLVVRDTPEQIAAIENLLARIDKPAPQVMISAYVLTGKNTEEGNAPAELAAALRELLPYSSYQIEAAGVLRTATSPQNHFNLSMRGNSGNVATNTTTTYQIQASITAFDQDQQSLTFDNLNFSGSGPNLNGQLFNTSTTIFGGEYAVLGVSGGAPVFAVLRMRPVGPAPAKKSN